MNIAVINGSPKGEISVTVQYIKFIQKKFPQHDLKLFNVSHDILKIEKDPKNPQHLISVYGVGYKLANVAKIQRK